MTHIDIVFDGPPHAIAGRFVEVEDSAGNGVKLGEWVERSDGYWALRIPASQTPTDGERGALPIAPRETWNWGTCVVCGSKEVSDRGMVIMGASNGAPYVARIAWCDQSQECREDLRQTSFLLTEFDANMIDQPEEDKRVTHAAQIADRNSELMERLAQAPTDEEREEIVRIIGGHVDLPVSSRLVIARSILAAGFRRPAQTEPTDIQFAARRIGKSQALIDSMLAQANEHGIRVEVVYPQTEPTDAQAIAARDELQRRESRVRAALGNLFSAGQEGKP